MYNKITHYLFALYPLFILTGPALPEILLVIFSITYFCYGKNYCNKKILKILFIFFFTVLVSTVTSKYTYLEKHNFQNLYKSILHFRFLIFFLWVLYFFKSNIFEKKFNFILKIVLIFLFADVTIQYFTGTDLIGNSKSNIGRLSGPFNDEYIVGGVILKIYIMYFILNFNFIFSNKKKLYEFIIFLNLTIFTILITGERATFIFVTIFTLSITVYSFFKKRSIFYYLIISLILFSPIIFKYSNFFIDRIKDISSVQQTFDSKVKKENYKNFLGNIKNIGYYAHYYSAITILKNNSLLGVGQRNYRIACMEVKNLPSTKEFLIKNPEITEEFF